MQVAGFYRWKCLLQFTWYIGIEPPWMFYPEFACVSSCPVLQRWSIVLWLYSACGLQRIPNTYQCPKLSERTEANYFVGLPSQIRFVIVCKEIRNTERMPISNPLYLDIYFDKKQYRQQIKWGTKPQKQIRLRCLNFE